MRHFRKLLRGENSALKFDYIFVVSYGRSGSTLLQGVLNSIEGVLIRGENNNCVYRFYRADQVLRIARTLHMANRRPENPWYGISGVDLDAFRSGIRFAVVNGVLRPRSLDTVLGFKEIRFTTMDMCDTDFEQYLDFMRRVFPRAAFIFNTRDLSEVVKSSWWARNPDSLKILSATDERFRKYLQRKLPDCFHVHYNDYIGNLGALAPLFDFIGADFDEANVALVISKKHCYKKAKKRNNKKYKIYKKYKRKIATALNYKTYKRKIGAVLASRRQLMM